MVAVINEVGNRYGRLIVLERDGSIRNHAAWLCQCDCGNTATVPGIVLRAGRTKSCGCLKEEFLGQLPEGEAAFNSLFYNYKRSARTRCVEFRLTKKDVRDLTQQDCAYCGSPPGAIHEQTGCVGEYVYNGIDRVNNEVGYIKENCVPCCKFCNQAKKWNSLEEFIAYLDRVAAHRNKVNGR